MWGQFDHLFMSQIDSFMCLICIDIEFAIGEFIDFGVGH